MDKRERETSDEEGLWFSYSKSYSTYELRCPRCGGKLYEEFNWELPDNLREFACLTCGYRVLIDEREVKMEDRLSSPSSN